MGRLSLYENNCGRLGSGEGDRLVARAEGQEDRGMNRVAARAVSNSGSAIRERKGQDSAGRMSSRWHTLAAPGEKCGRSAQDRVGFLGLFTVFSGTVFGG